MSGDLLRLLEYERVRRRFTGDLLRLRLGVYDPRRLLGEGDLEREYSGRSERDLPPRAPGSLDLDLDLDMDPSGDWQPAGGDFLGEGERDMLADLARGFAGGEEPSLSSCLLALSTMGDMKSFTSTLLSGCTVGSISFLQHSGPVLAILALVRLSPAGQKYAR